MKLSVYLGSIALAACSSVSPQADEVKASLNATQLLAFINAPLSPEEEAAAEATHFYDLYNTLLAGASDDPVAVGGVVFRGVHTFLVNNRASFLAAEGSYGTLGKLNQRMLASSGDSGLAVTLPMLQKGLSQAASTIATGSKPPSELALDINVVQENNGYTTVTINQQWPINDPGKPRVTVPVSVTARVAGNQPIVTTVQFNGGKPVVVEGTFHNLQAALFAGLAGIRPGTPSSGGYRVPPETFAGFLEDVNDVPHIVNDPMPRVPVIPRL